MSRLGLLNGALPAVLLLLCSAQLASAQIYIGSAAYSGSLSDGSAIGGSFYYTNSSLLCPASNPCIFTSLGTPAFIQGTFNTPGGVNDPELPCIGSVSPSLAFTDLCYTSGNYGNQLTVNFSGPIDSAGQYSITGEGTYGYPGDPHANLPIVSGEIAISITQCLVGPNSDLCPSGPLTVTTTTLPATTSGKSYGQQLYAVGGTDTGYTWSIAGGTLAFGFSLTASGLITSTGTPVAAPGLYSFTLTVKDSAGAVASRSLTLVVNPSAVTPPPPPAVTILDPVPNLLLGPQITSNRSDLATIGRTVKGIAADGIAQVVLRIPTTAAGIKVSASLLSNCTVATDPSTCTLSSSTDDDGGLFKIGTSFDSVANTASDTSDPATQDAFIAYRAPVDFVRLASSSDQDLASRIVYVKLSYSSGATVYDSQTVPLVIVRPPVILIHGTFSDPSVFDNFSPVVGNEMLFTTTLDYSKDIDAAVTGTIPDYTTTRERWAHIKRNVIGVEYNAPLLLHEMIGKINAFKTQSPEPINLPVAAVQADIVAHSLGGLMARGMAHVGIGGAYAGNNAFYGNHSYGLGYIHKLITLGTPHLGTDLALLSVNGTNDCTRNEAAMFGNYSLTSATINGNDYYGAALDQAGDPTEGLSSTLGPTLSLLNAPRTQTIPTAFIATTFSPANDNPLVLPVNGTAAKWACGTRTVIEYLHGPSITLGSHCGSLPPCPAHGADPVGCCKVIPGDFLADNYSFDHWHNIFTDVRGSDVIVPFTSATLAQSVYSTRDGVVHGPGTVGFVAGDGPHIGFAGPQLLDPAGPIPTMVLQLLNTSVRDVNNFVNIP